MGRVNDQRGIYTSTGVTGGLNSRPDPTQAETTVSHYSFPRGDRRHDGTGTGFVYLFTPPVVCEVARRFARCRVPNPAES